MKHKVDHQFQLNTGGLVICLGFHALADSLLMGRAWILENEQLWIAIALPLSQCSLFALWAATSRSSPYLRFVVPLLGAVASWWMLTQLLTWGVGEAAPAAWALAIAAQTMLIIVATNLYQRAVDPGAQRYAIDLRTLILWTTAAAIAFCFVQYGREVWRWTMVLADWEFFGVVPIFGVFNALLAVLWLWALAAGDDWKRRSAKIVIVLLFIGLASVALTYLVAWIVGSPVFGFRESCAFTATQSILLSGTIACALIGARRSSPLDIRPQTTNLTAS